MTRKIEIVEDYKIYFLSDDLQADISSKYPGRILLKNILFYITTIKPNNQSAGGPREKYLIFLHLLGYPHYYILGINLLCNIML